MGNIFLQDKKIILRPLEEKDLNESYLGWLNDEEVCHHNSHAIYPYTERKMREYFDKTQNDNTIVVLAIMDKVGKKHIGNVSLQNIDYISRSAEFAIIIGDKNYWQRGVGASAAKLIINYGFERLNLSRIYCGTSSENIGMQKLAEKLNMKKEGVRRQAMYKMGKYIDIIEYGLLRREFKE